jgi:hypothetical protein
VQFAAQAPFEQNWPEGHAFPQPPQLAGSSSVSTQALPQRVVPPRQVTPHVPVEQT